MAGCRAHRPVSQVPGSPGTSSRLHCIPMQHVPCAPDGAGRHMMRCPSRPGKQHSGHCATACPHLQQAARLAKPPAEPPQPPDGGLRQPSPALQPTGCPAPTGAGARPGGRSRVRLPEPDRLSEARAPAGPPSPCRHSCWSTPGTDRRKDEIQSPGATMNGHGTDKLLPMRIPVNGHTDTSRATRALHTQEEVGVASFCCCMSACVVQRCWPQGCLPKGTSASGATHPT